MRMNKHTPTPELPVLQRFQRDESGAILVEFALVLPLMLVFFAVIGESARTFWSYQQVISGVRDASRYLARVAPLDICDTGGSLVGYTGSITNIVKLDRNGSGIFPSTITVNSVTPTLTCVTGSFRNGPASIAQVSANITIDFPMGFIFDFFGDAVGSATTVVADQSRIYGI